MFLSTAIRAGKRKGIQLNKSIRTLFGNHWIELAVRWILGVIFVYASYNKILAPAAFAKIIYGYDLFPAVFINLIAIIVPFLELFAGLALIIGVYPTVCRIDRKWHAPGLYNRTFHKSYPRP